MYQTPQSSGVDLRANIKMSVKLKPLERVLIPTGLKIELPNGYEAQIRPRSGLALKHGISLANAIGTCDSDYRGEIGVILINLSNEEYVVQPSERIAQMVITKYEQVDFVLVDKLSETERGDGGFGHSGKK